MVKWKVGAVQLKGSLVVNLPEGAVPFNVELPHAYYGDGAKKAAVEISGVVYFIAPLKE